MAANDLIIDIVGLSILNSRTTNLSMAFSTGTLTSIHLYPFYFWTGSAPRLFGPPRTDFQL